MVKSNYYTNSKEFIKRPISTIKLQGNQFVIIFVGKVFSGIINVRVVNYCEENGANEDEQNGVRKHRSC